MLDSAGLSSQKLRSALRIPPSTQDVLLAFHVLDLKAARESSENRVVKFSGQYMDNVEISPRRTTPLP